jgi:hypothetical protein
VFHCEFRITTQSAAGTGKSINLKKVIVLLFFLTSKFAYSNSLKIFLKGFYPFRKRVTNLSRLNEISFLENFFTIIQLSLIDWHSN